MRLPPAAACTQATSAQPHVVRDRWVGFHLGLASDQPLFQMGLHWQVGMVGAKAAGGSKDRPCLLDGSVGLWETRSRHTEAVCLDLASGPSW